MGKYIFTPTEVLSEDADDGTIVDNVAHLAESVVGRRIVKVEGLGGTRRSSVYSAPQLRITLDTGATVELAGTADCCAGTDLESFLWNAKAVDHIITGIRTENGYGKWSIFADFGDVLELTVDWGCGNPFYYGYGFEITVKNPDGTEQVEA